MCVIMSRCLLDINLEKGSIKKTKGKKTSAIHSSAPKNVNKLRDEEVAKSQMQ